MRVKDIKSGGAYLINRRWAIRAGGPTPVTNPDVASMHGCDDVFGKAELIAVGALIRYDLLGKVGIGYSVTMWMKETDEVLPINEGTFCEIQKEARDHDVRLTQLRWRVIDSSVGAVLMNG